MSDLTGAPAGDIAAPADTSELSLTEARAMLDAQLSEPEQEQSAESADPATAEQKLSDEGNAGPEEVPGEKQEADPVEVPSIEPPRSWTKEAKDRWNTIPREAQEEFARIEQGREREFLRLQQDTAEKLKGLTAKEQQVEQARQQYEAAKLAPLDRVAILEYEQSKRFPDIKSNDDLRRLAAQATQLWQSDPVLAGQIQSYLQEWNVHQGELASAVAEKQGIEARSENERQSAWSKHVQKENTLAAELIPELADKDKGPALTKRAAERLSELGFKPEELNDLANGKKQLSIYDHRIQQLIFSDLKLSYIQSAKKPIAAKPLPPVQRPGIARPSGSADSENIQALEKRLTQTGLLKDAEALLNAQLAAQSRRRAS